MPNDDKTLSTPTNTVSLDTAKEVIRLSELYIDGTIRLSLASDTRAMQIASMSAAATTALLLFSFNNIVQTAALNKTLGWASMAAGVLFFLALVYALRAAKPRHFHVNGTTLAQWDKSELFGDLSEALLGQSKVYLEQIQENRQTLAANAKRIRFSLFMLAAAPIASLVVGLIAYCVFKP
jgi:hypothetical protein